jgi:hypothetical protein
MREKGNPGNRKIPNVGRKMLNVDREISNVGRKLLNAGRKMLNVGPGDQKWIAGSSLNPNWKDYGN